MSLSNGFAVLSLKFCETSVVVRALAAISCARSTKRSSTWCAAGIVWVFKMCSSDGESMALQVDLAPEEIQQILDTLEYDGRINRADAPSLGYDDEDEAKVQRQSIVRVLSPAT